MMLTDISLARLKSQMITFPQFSSAKEIVSHMGAIQAQDYAMAKWAIGTRMRDPSLQKIQSSIDKGEIIRIHLLRPTWHLVAAEDVYWMIQLSAQKIKSSAKTRFKDLGLSDSVLAKATGVIGQSLSGGISLTREELAQELRNAKIRTEETRLSHILFWSELEGIVCSGPDKNNKITYNLLSDRIPHIHKLSRDESLAELAKRYFLSRSPATPEDFAWWTNLTLTDARKAIDFSKESLHTETLGDVKYWLSNSKAVNSETGDPVHLLPAFDELLISYSNRSSSLSLLHNKKAVTNNGIFHPPIIINGQVAGLWKRTIQKDKVIIEINLFQQPGKSIMPLICQKAEIYANFLDKKPEITHKAG
jgi:hypothetical protein